MRAADGRIHITGGGPAGAAAAMAALGEGREVLLVERSRFPRHKVCGEFLSPEIVPLLERLGAGEDFRRAGAATIRRMALYFPKAVKRCRLPEAAYGLSRFRFDELLWKAALRQGATAAAEPPADAPPVAVEATGRAGRQRRGDRLFGFKAHFHGPASDAVELFFFDGCYVGVNAVENGVTNVCGIAAEDSLARRGFEMDAVVGSNPALAERLAPLRRVMKWMCTGPLVFGHRLRQPMTGPLIAGDALSFVDPFTGSGLLSAVTTGRLAGLAAARRSGADRYVRDCRSTLQRPFEVSSVFRSLVRSGWAERLVPLAPGAVLFWLTRPSRAI